MTPALKEPRRGEDGGMSHSCMTAQEPQNALLFTDSTKEYLTRFYCILDEMIQKMRGACLTDSISHNFIRQMIPHHMAAIEMSRNILAYSDFEPVRRIACGIISEQTKSIQNMQNVLEVCSCRKNSAQDLALYARRFDQVTRTMFCGMEEACSDNNKNADFMREMIPHHRGAIGLSRNALNYPICPQLQPILEAIITSQSEGIRQMECLLKG